MLRGDCRRVAEPLADIGQQIQVHNVTDPGAPPVNANGQVTGTLGALVAHYSYDAIGRLIARQTPWDSGRDSLRLEWFHHDGARRVQELVSSEVPVGQPLPLDLSSWPSGLATGRGCDFPAGTRSRTPCL